MADGSLSFYADCNLFALGDQEGWLGNKHVTLVYASEDGLSTFLSGSLDAFAAGLTERIEARSLFFDPASLYF